MSIEEQELPDTGVVTAPTPEAPPAEAPEDKGTDEHKPVMSEVETVAVKMGWAPKDEWRGRQEDHRSAEE